MSYSVMIAHLHPRWIQSKVCRQARARRVALQNSRSAFAGYMHASPQIRLPCS